MRTFLTFLFGCIFSLSFTQLNAQSITPADLVQSEKDLFSTFSDVTPFSAAVQKNSLVDELDASVVDFDVLNISSQVLKQFSKSAAPETMTFQVPFETKNTTLELELVKVDIFTSDFQVTLGSTGEAADVEMGVHYRGIIKNDPSSVVAISIFEEEVMGLIANDEGNLVLGKLQGSSWNGEHILYDDRTVLSDHHLDCATPDDGIGYKATDLDFDYAEKAVGDCIRLYIEVDNDIHNDKGGVTAASNFAAGLLNEVITLYANESIASVVSEIKVWDTTSPYSSTSSSGMLSDFQAATGSFNGELAQLLSYQASGGIAAGFAGICNSNPDNSKAFSSINSTYSTVPTYSWSVMVTTHEFGHLWGSRHTHACVWNGNNTAIDGCAGSTEGSCSLPGFPSGGGTIMSYCHLQSVGINLANGFGPQPGNVIRNSVANASCTAPCGPPTCTDGIQNGNETGVDCGGPDCPACPTCSDGVQNGNETGVDCGGPDCPPCPCTGENVTLTIVLDNYPEETSWEITAGGTTYASGGTYGSQPDGSTVIEVACLNDGCYDFTINDSYGDGICCSYGNGSYLLEDASGNTLASGGAFGSSETTNFCVSSGGGDTTPPTNPTSLSASNTTQTTTDLSWNASTDNVGVTGYNVYVDGSNIGQVTGTAANITGLSPSTTYAMYVTAVDAAGNESGQSNTVNVTTLSNGGGGCTPTTYGPYSFESGLEGWVDGGSDCFRAGTTTYSYDGSYSIRIRDNSGSSYTNSPSLDLAEFSSVEIEFYFIPRGMENGEDFWVRYNDGTGWQTVATYVVDGSNISNNQFYVATVTLNSSNVNLVDGALIRFQNDASVNNDRVYLDLITITGNCTGLPAVGSPMFTYEEVKTPGINAMNPTFDMDIEVSEGFSLYPNPTTNELNLNIPEDMNIQNVRIFSISGQLMQVVTPEAAQEEIDVTRLESGIYFLSIETDEEVVNKKFIKQ